MSQPKTRKRPRQKQPVVINYFHQHALAARQGMQQLRKQYLLNTIVVFVIGLAMSLPTLLFLGFQYVQHYSTHWHDSAQAAIYLQKNIPADSRDQLIESLKNNTHIKEVSYISPEQGLNDFKTHSNIGSAIDLLEENPLPGVILITPYLNEQPLAFQQLTKNLNNNTIVDNVDLDTDWLKRLLSLMHLGKHTIALIAMLLGTSMLFIIGNMVYLVLQRYSHDIDIFLTLGASKRFIRRPYLYMGLYYGLLSAGTNWLIIALCYQWLSPALTQFAQSYGTTFAMSPPDAMIITTSVMMSLGLGFLGARLAAGQFLRQQIR
jgi:cell division transport system permease protein